jgi:hypothetical protein
MSNWPFLNEKCRVTKSTPRILSRYISDASYGFNGMFRIPLDGRILRVIASDGDGWQHVSVTEENNSKPPKWEIMCKIKDLFWEPEDWVVQFHPPLSQYINNHPGCLHLWRCTDEKQPTPSAILVGIKT